MLLPLSVMVLAVSFVLVAIRQIGSIKLQIWQIILGGAAVVLITGQISITAAISYINPTVIVFLVGIFILGEAMTRSGYIQYLASKLFKSFKSVDGLVLAILFSMGFASMFMINDTMAIVGTPVVMFLRLGRASTLSSCCSPLHLQ